MVETKILDVIVGSQAHGLATPESDYDYRGVFVNPTAEILKLGGSNRQTSWIEGKEDMTSWEIGHFLHLATKCNPTILEVFLSPLILVNEDGLELTRLFPHIWNSKGVMDAFIGYGLNQRKKFLEDKEGRANKYSAAYLRTLFNAWQLLTQNIFQVKISETEIGETVRAYKNGNFKYGEVIETCRLWEEKVRKAYAENPNKETNMEAVNEFLLKIRRKYFV